MWSVFLVLVIGFLGIEVLPESLGPRPGLLPLVPGQCKARDPGQRRLEQVPPVGRRSQEVDVPDPGDILGRPQLYILGRTLTVLQQQGQPAVLVPGQGGEVTLADSYLWTARLTFCSL